MRILYIEPFEVGSHEGFSRALVAHLDARWTALTLPGRHWKWRMRGSAARFALDQSDVLAQPHDLLLCSSYLPLAELVGLCPPLGRIPRVLYFHENQLAYPVRHQDEDGRDLHFAFTQMVSALAATRCVFNSQHNLETFLDGGDELLRRMPDEVPSRWIDRIRERSHVLPIPLDLDAAPVADFVDGDRTGGPIILWNHRWEHDKDPDTFFSALSELKQRGAEFRVAVCGQRFQQVPPVFDRARELLGDRIVHFGHAPSRGEYEALLRRAHIVVSTARHEFFGVAVLEATHFGARPVLPDRLAYRELFPEEFRYAEGTLVDTLAALTRDFATGDVSLRSDRRALTRAYRASAVVPRYEAFFRGLVGEGSLA